jgi:hypothetical protein
MSGQHIISVDPSYLWRKFMKTIALAAAGILLGCGIGMAQTTSGQSAASGNSNQAVATTSENAPMPAKGANSFTMGEAQSRIEKNGFTNVSALNKDSDGVWHGTAQRNGSSTPVWLDYKGNVGTK